MSLQDQSPQVKEEKPWLITLFIKMNALPTCWSTTKNAKLLMLFQSNKANPDNFQKFQSVELMMIIFDISIARNVSLNFRKKVNF